MKCIHSEKGVISIETIFGVVFIAVLFMTFSYILDGILLHARIQNAIAQTAKDISISSAVELRNQNSYATYTACSDLYMKTRQMNGYLNARYYMPDIATIKLERGEVDIATGVRDIFKYYYEMREDVPYLEKMGVSGGLAGLDFSQSTYDPYGSGYVTIVVTYDYDIFRVPLFALSVKRKMMQTAKTKIWR